MSAPEIVWRTPPLATALYFIEQADSAGVDPARIAPLQRAARELRTFCTAHYIKLPELMKYLVPQAAHPMGNRDLAQVALAKSLGRGKGEPLEPELASILAMVKAAWKAGQQAATGGEAADGGADELLLRSQPLRMQWEARGVGILAQLRRWLPAEVLPERATVLLVEPLLGGGGRAYPLYNIVRLEAVLTDVVPGLPEVVRLAWLIASLNSELQQYGPTISARRAIELGELALLPAVLNAAAEVELCAAADEATIASAIEAWQIGTVQPTQVTALANWWTTYVDTRPDWTVGLAALDAMLQSS